METNSAAQSIYCSDNNVFWWMKNVPKRNSSLKSGDYKLWFDSYLFFRQFFPMWNQQARTSTKRSIRWVQIPFDCAVWILDRYLCDLIMSSICCTIFFVWLVLLAFLYTFHLSAQLKWTFLHGHVGTKCERGGLGNWETENWSGLEQREIILGLV